MGVSLQCVNHDEVFNNLPYEPLMVNSLDTSTPEKLIEFKRHIYSHYNNSDTIEESAACTCKKITDVEKIGTYCPDCHTKVEGSNERPIVPSMWMDAPEGVTSLISPHLWIILDSNTTTKEFNFLRYLTDTKYKFTYERLSSKETKRKVDRLLEKNFERGLNAFIRDFDTIVEFFFQANIIDKNKAELSQFIRNNKHCFFPQVLPLPSRVCMVVESTTSGTYIDKPILLAVDAALSMASIGSTNFKLKPIEVQNITAQSIATLSMFHQIYDKDRLARKPGLIRRHVLASSLYLTGRNVITSISKPHNYEQIELPWGMAVQLFKYHIISKLFKRGYTANKALAAVYQNVLNDTPNPLLVEIFNELIAESNGGLGPACIFGRNPTLQRGSTQMFYIGTIKTNTRDNTISMSVLCLKAPNADFDGDQLNLTLLADNQLTQAASRLAPHLWVWSLHAPHEISGNLEIQGPVIETAASWITRARLTAKANREGRMA